ncbi:hypothetical protein GALMADRAFT_249095 [Galerina marginata CBS 339.88]|uniref:Uncharacterized protein n=1 Tax=Galerina marginata (strain CBS 339.88) TaxID=685588 RepID=A0A067T828_GALM3|nr:hypothetical protein GALMADRAFT_249095 [Galerina marginata CBS 339.88]
MPPKAKPVKSGSSSKDLVPVGKREVFAQSQSKDGKQEKITKPTTERALVLRNGKYGSQGTGELMLMSKMSGREKLDLLAESLVEESKKAVLSPFRLETCLRIAESQADAYIDDISNLRDPELFRSAIEAELEARTEPEKDPRKNASNVAKLVATRVHNAYMLASAWKLVSNSLDALAIDGLTDKTVKSKLKNNSDMRDRYLVLYDMVNDLVSMSQDRFSVLATTTPHYAKYFKLKVTEAANSGVPEYVFDWKDLRKAADSFLDSIIIELCFPQGTYPKAILYRILHDAIEESPREAKRFPQALWNAVGDLSVSVELQELLSAPLFGPEGEEWKKQPRQMPEEYERWVDAQIYSERATNMFASFKDIIFPLEKTRRKSELDAMWKQINNNYVTVSGEDIDVLWQLDGAFDYAPQWSAYAVMPDIDEESDDDLFPGRPGAKSKSKSKKKTLAITAGSDSDGSMPGLQSVSNTSDDEDSDLESDDEDEEEEDASDDESGYNTEEEDELRELHREAMDAALEADWLNSDPNAPAGIDPFLQEDRKGNPFLKILGSLRGRMFSSSPKLKTATRTEPRPTATRGAFRATPSGAPKAVPKTMPKPAPAPVPTKTPVATPAPAPAPKSQRATVEDVEDVDDVSPSSPKKKKKKPKKKKKAASDMPGSPSPSFQSLDSIATSATKQSLDGSISSPKTTPSVAPQTPASPKPSISKATATYSASTISLPIGETSTQSGHSYLKSLNTGTEKKVKSRPDHASLFSNSDTKKSGFFSKISGGGKEKEGDTANAKRSWFSNLGKKANTLMHQLLKTQEDQTDGRAPMKWENFLRLMREMGFTYDPSTAGSSVRFDPPNKGDRSITFHKPHPDPTLQPVMLKEFAKKLKRYYGWDEEDLLRV